jgi:hypothetical protein
MPAIAAPSPPGAGPDIAELDDAREARDYWETRAATLPRLAFRARSEAREMAALWRTRVTDAERAAYGHGLRGALMLMSYELCLPERARQASRQVARRARHLAVALVVAVIVVLAAAAAALVALALALVGALT